VTEHAVIGHLLLPAVTVTFSSVIQISRPVKVAAETPAVTATGPVSRSAPQEADPVERTAPTERRITSRTIGPMDATSAETADSEPVQDSSAEPRKRGDARRERWREHRRARRAEFVAAAVRAITEQGHEVGMADIAVEAGVSKPVLYRHFSDKSDLYGAVGQCGTELLMNRLRPLRREGGSPNRRIRRLVDGYLGVIAEHPELYRFVVRRNFADRPLRDDPVAVEKTVIANSLSRLLGNYMRLLGLDSGGVEPWSHGLVGMVQASGEWWLDRN